MDDPSPPIACTLDEAALADRAGAWRQVIAVGLRDRIQTADGMELRFDPAVEDAVRQLVALEADCCAWFEGHVTRVGDTVAVDLRAFTVDGRDVLRAMFAAP